MSELNIVQLKTDEVLFRQGDQSNELYIILEGELLVCVNKGSTVTAITFLNSGYLGEFSFFDKEARSSHVIATKDTKLIKIPHDGLDETMPNWFTQILRKMSSEIRLLDEIIQEKGIKKNKLESIRPLSIEEQRHYLQIIQV